jgi:SAM-dependent methyltransferase
LTSGSRATLAFWDARYRDGDTPWDTGIVPPEIVSLVESGDLTAGWALDLGCGSGVASRYLARQGFSVVGIDLAQSALARAARSAVSEGIAARFCLGNVTDLGFLKVQAALAVDVGCFHSIDPERRPAYIDSLACHLLPGAPYLLYAFGPVVAEEGGPAGLGPRDLALFAPAFLLCWSQHGHDRGRRSAWYLWRRTNFVPNRHPAYLRAGASGLE